MNTRALDREAFFARLRARILRHVEVHPCGCWLWTGRVNNCGYPILTARLNGYKHPRPLFAHRVTWEAFHRRRVPRSRVVAHHYRCIAPRCCNPEHLRATTQSSNARDRIRTKRWRAKQIRIEFPPFHTITEAACTAR